MGGGLNKSEPSYEEDLNKTFKSALRHVSIDKLSKHLKKLKDNDADSVYNIAVDGLENEEDMSKLNSLLKSNSEKLFGIRLPETVETVKENTFSGLDNLVTVTLPKSIKSIENNAFSGCSSLKEIDFKGSSSQWNDISFGENWNTDLPEDCGISATSLSSIKFNLSVSNECFNSYGDTYYYTSVHISKLNITGFDKVQIRYGLIGVKGGYTHTHIGDVINSSEGGSNMSLKISDINGLNKNVEICIYYFSNKLDAYVLIDRLPIDISSNLGQATTSEYDRTFSMSDFD